jgi:hypothetical protein
MIRVNFSSKKKEYVEPEIFEKMTAGDQQSILMYFINQVIQTQHLSQQMIKSLTKTKISFILSDHYDDIDNFHTYFFSIKIYGKANIFSIGALISTISSAIITYLNKDIVMMFKRVQYKRETRKSELKGKIDKEDFEKLCNFFITEKLEINKKSSNYVKRKFGQVKTIYSLEKIFSKDFTAVELYFLNCKLLNKKPLKSHIIQNDEEIMSDISDFIS